MQDLEFTVERGKLYMLQTRSGKRSAEAAVKIAIDIVARRAHRERRGDLRRVERATQLEAALLLAHRSRRELRGGRPRGSTPHPARRPGGRLRRRHCGRAWASAAKHVILVRNETAPDDVHGMIAAKGVLTCKGGATSHAAVVARGMGMPCVCGLRSAARSSRAREDGHASAGRRSTKATGITIDGTTGTRRARQAELDPAAVGAARVAGRPSWAGPTRSSAWRCGPTPTRPRTRARRASSARPGSACAAPSTCSCSRTACRSCQDMIIADTPEARDAALAKLLVFQRDDFLGILEAMAGYPVTIRLLDPPLHEFLPSLEELLVETTELRLTKGERLPRVSSEQKMLVRARAALHEVNPMLGLRVCRLGHRLSGDLRDAGARDLRSRVRTAQARRRREARRDDSRRRDARRDAASPTTRPRRSPTR